MKKTALISGISGQDGAFLARILLDNGYHVVGTSRDVSRANFDSLRKLNILDLVELVSLSPIDLMGVINTIKKYQPSEIYNLSGQSSVSVSFAQPHSTMESIIMGTLNFLEAIRFSNNAIKFYNAGSSEMFGSAAERVNEKTRLAPRSPYAVAKAASFFEVANYREAYSLFATTGILFNHESPFRGDNFVTKKIIHGAVAIANGQKKDKLELGNISIKRDWGWAPEYMTAVWKMLQLDKPHDLIIATGETHSLENFLEMAFGYFNLSWKDHVILNDSLKRPSDLDAIFADPGEAERVLKWKSKIKLNAIVKNMIEYEIDGKFSLV
ncbi:MAG: GDP-mannose 4,6-dehydratase [Bacteriovoracaceae bacterium]|nr:GDP-mannose 4,6-dehydratase [Bacteriovoracaceae bacterium]